MTKDLMAKYYEFDNTVDVYAAALVATLIRRMPNKDMYKEIIADLNTNVKQFTDIISPEIDGPLVGLLIIIIMFSN